MVDVNQEIKNTLREILAFVGADQKYAEYAQLTSYMEWFLRNCMRGKEVR